MGTRIGQQAGVGYVDEYPGTAIAWAHGGIRLDPGVHFLGFRRRTRAGFPRCDGHHMIRRRASLAELLVDLAEHVGHIESRPAEVEQDYVPDDPPDSVGVISPQLGLIAPRVGLIQPLDDL